MRTFERFLKVSCTGVEVARVGIGVGAELSLQRRDGTRQKED
jgi:hypothetical protein